MNPQAIFWLVITCISMMMTFATALASDPLVEVRYCAITPSRDADGSISRRADVLRAFKAIHACPSTEKHSGACPGWSMDHVIPLANGGCDAVSNLQWLPHQIKSCAGEFCKDRWERKVYKPQYAPPVEEPKTLEVLLLD